jgi:hypothetical protein
MDNEHRRSLSDEVEKNILKGMEDMLHRLEKVEDKQNAANIKIALVVGGCIVAATLIPIVVVFLEKMTFK